jgi:hypothetical protein
VRKFSKVQEEKESEMMIGSVKVRCLLLPLDGIALGVSMMTMPTPAPSRARLEYESEQGPDDA